MKPMVKEHLFFKLVERREALLSRLAADRAQQSGAEPDEVDRVATPALRSGFDGLERKELAEVEAALRRIEQHRFGRCEVCGAAVAPERLEALPEARTCVDCSSDGSARG